MSCYSEHFVFCGWWSTVTVVNLGNIWKRVKPSCLVFSNICFLLLGEGVGATWTDCTSRFCNQSCTECIELLWDILQSAFPVTKTRLFIYVMFCATWYHLYNLKFVKNTHGGVLLLVKLQGKRLQLYWKYHSSMGVFHVF